MRDRSTSVLMVVGRRVWTLGSSTEVGSESVSMDEPGERFKTRFARGMLRSTLTEWFSTKG